MEYVGPECLIVDTLGVYCTCTSNFMHYSLNGENEAIIDRQ